MLSTELKLAIAMGFSQFTTYAAIGSLFFIGGLLVY